LTYINGIEGSQQIAHTAEVAASAGANRTTNASTGPVPGQSELGGGSSVDQATLSTAASAVAQALTGSDVRSDKVAALQESIAAGTYNIPSSAVAAKVLSAMLN
jgi:negative regulator of flagellin synthesis FlgM